MSCGGFGWSVGQNIRWWAFTVFPRREFWRRCTHTVFPRREGGSGKVLAGRSEGQWLVVFERKDSCGKTKTWGKMDFYR